MHFQFPQKVLFKHCDPAGIVFYPRIFEMINDAVEALFSDVLEWPFEEIHPKAAVPTAEFNVRFKAPCRHGDHLVLGLQLTRLGRASLSLTTTARRDNTVCFEADQVLVCVGPDGRPVAWPKAVRETITSLMEA
ncbi:MAG: thioesterase family protein [Pseudomonadota bacterium]